MTGFCCVYKRPYEHADPWQCPECKLWHAVPCEPTRTNEPSIEDVWTCVHVRNIEEWRVKAQIPCWLADVMLDALIERGCQP